MTADEIKLVLLAAFFVIAALGFIACTIIVLFLPFTASSHIEGKLENESRLRQ